jgi:hypothetical protein
MNDIEAVELALQFSTRLGRYLENRLKDLKRQREAERKLADMLVEALNSTRWDCPVLCEGAILTWEAARKESSLNSQANPPR